MAGKKLKSRRGASLIEVMAAIVILALIIVPVGGSFVLSFRLNHRSEQLLQEQLAVSNAVELLMAKGVDPADPPTIEGVTVDIDEANAVKAGDVPICYPVTVTYAGGADPVAFTTTVRYVPAEGDGGEEP